MISGFSITGGSWPVMGMTTGSIAAGQVGELLYTTVALASGVSLTNGVAANLATLALTPGFWNCWMQCDFNSTGCTASVVASSISTASGVLGVQTANGILGPEAYRQIPVRYSNVTAVYGIGTGIVRATNTADATIYAVVQANFTAGSMSVYGTIFAERIF